MGPHRRATSTPSVAWATRMKKWGLFSPHFLAKNPGVALPILLGLRRAGWPRRRRSRSTSTGLRSGSTMPFYLWILWPKKHGWLYAVVAIAAFLPAFQELLYQNSGWRQFGYRFSNDYAVLLFNLALRSATARRWMSPTAAAWGGVEPVLGRSRSIGASSIASISARGRRPSSTSLTEDRMTHARGSVTVTMAAATIAGCALLGGCQTASGPQPSAPVGGHLSSLTVTSKSVPGDQQIPVDYTCDGTDVPPQLTWSAPPDGTKSIAIVVDDQDSSSGAFTHWIVIDLPADALSLAEGIDPTTLGAKIGQNDFSELSLQRYAACRAASCIGTGTGSTRWTRFSRSTKGRRGPISTRRSAAIFSRPARSRRRSRTDDWRGGYRLSARVSGRACGVARGEAGGRGYRRSGGRSRLLPWRISSLPGPCARSQKNVRQPRGARRGGAGALRR